MTQRLTLGALEVSGLTDLARFDIPLSEIMPGADPAALDGIDWIGPEVLSDGILHMAMRAWLLRLEGRVILIDTCVGDDKDRPARPEWHRRRSGALIAALAAEGLRPDDVDVVMCTHLHADHVGWNTVREDGRWVPTFPGARYVCGRTEYRHWDGAADAHGAFADSVLPVMAAGRMDLVEDGWELARGLTLETTPGHTPGHMCIHADHGAGAVFAGDAIHSPVQLARPDWVSAFCSDAEAARASRLRLLEELADSGRWLIPAHFPDPGWMRVARAGRAFRPAA
ncbi:MBL fold metallo-hydrolase [Rhodosalinus halophilus]|uniref:MBL fold metallo-hydrolase n=1 Tax=Rhodosalinus halophilus TaxID=2259333 RepID=A0A365UAU9_9RHOB|nr:MBL fold metallo-hydrolase [Rhodosalinus halophilus]RBI86332.1 MBL fold metallo-hydrolase [Rhodosalinus halophilus]